MVTPAGIIATDPIDADAARWLKAELSRRFAKPVKYLVYSHDHADHISGGEVFADTAIVIAHERTQAVILNDGRRRCPTDVQRPDDYRGNYQAYLPLNIDGMIRYIQTQRNAK